MVQKFRVIQHQVKGLLFGIADKVPPVRFQRYAIASNFMFVFALGGHAAFIPIYWLLGSFYPFALNCFFVPVDIICLYLNRRGQYPAAYIIWTVLVVLHSIGSSLVFGWAAGFHYYIFSLTVFIFITPWKKSINILSLCVIAIIYLWLNRTGAGLLTAVQLPVQFERAVNAVNIVVNFIILGYLANHYVMAANKIQHALQESEKTLKTILAVSPVGIVLVIQREVVWANDTFRQMLGYDESETLDRDILFFYNNIREIESWEHLAHEVGRPFIDVADTRLRKRDGTILPCNIKIRPNTPGDATKGSIIVVIDITEQKAAEKEKAAFQAKIQRAEKMEVVGVLAGGVAHDLNNILTGMIGYPDLMLFDMDAENPMRRHLEAIKKSGQKAATIVQDLLTLSRRGVSTEQVIDLNRVVCEYMGSPEHERLKYHHPAVGFQANLSAESLKVIGSPVHLSKTIMNLVSNATEAIGGSGTVTITTQKRCLKSVYQGYETVEPGAYVVLSVTDDGQGISSEDKEHIFEPFYTKKVMGRSGTGLGLAVVWGSVKDSRGYIDVVSRPGLGTRFDLYFPQTEDLARIQTHEQNLDSFKGNGEHILVVDDVEEQRMVAADMLEKLGYRVDVAASGEAAVSWMQDGRSDLLVLDMLMDPGIDGLETYRRILNLHPGQRAIIASGYSETQKVAAAIGMGAAQLLKKPYTLLELAMATRSALDQAQPENDLGSAADIATGNS